MNTPIKSSEQAMLSLALLSPEVRPWMISAGVSPRWFSGPIFPTAISVALEWDKTESVPMTLEAWVMRTAQRAELPQQQVAIELSKTLNHPASPSNIGGYAQTLRSEWERRQISTLTAQVLSEARDLGCDTLKLAERLSKVREIVNRPGQDTISGVEAILGSSSDLLDPIPTGLPDLDRLLDGGLRPGWLCCIGARTSMGKSTLAIDLCRHAATAGKRVLYLTLEMSAPDIARRFAAVGNPDSLSRLQIYSPSRTVTPTVIEGALLAAASDGCQLAAIDYLQLIGSERPGRSLHEIATEVSRTLRAITAKLAMPVLLVSQLSRKVTARTDRRPELSDLRDSGAIEEDADIVMLLHRPGYYDHTLDQSEAWLGVAKNRHGATGVVCLDWQASPPMFKPRWKP